LKKPSETDWKKIDRMTDEEIDVSDSPPLTDEFFARAEWRMPDKKTAVTLSVDSEVLKWFESQGADFQHRINAALKIYAEAHQK
jgi:uncharacterized protein (DUF4415 family)